MESSLRQLERLTASLPRHFPASLEALRGLEQALQLRPTTALSCLERQIGALHQLSRHLGVQGGIGTGIRGSDLAALTGRYAAALWTQERLKGISAALVGRYDWISRALWPREFPPGQLARRIHLGAMPVPGSRISTPLEALLRTQPEADDLRTFDKLREPINELVARVDAEILEAPAEPHHRLFWYSLLCSILLFVLGQIHTEYKSKLNADQLKELKEVLTQSLERIETNLAELTDLGHDNWVPDPVFVLRECSVCAKPVAHPAVLQRIECDTLVWVVARRGRWARVSYVHPHDGTIREGWVRKKYLAR